MSYLASAQGFIPSYIPKLKTRAYSDIGYGPLIREYVYFLLAKLAFHKQHPEFNGTFHEKKFQVYIHCHDRTL